MIDLATLAPARRRAMLDAGERVLASQRALERGGLNVVGEILRGQPPFVEYEHYPPDDVFDDRSFGQYYYHAHRGNDAEHGHFHVFLRAGGMPPDCAPRPFPHATERWPQGDDAICHLIAISMDPWGLPIGLFTTNRWVTGETWYPADCVIAMLDRFEIGHAFPNLAVNHWITAMLGLWRPHIEALVRERDRVIEASIATAPGADVFEDRRIDVTSALAISVEELVAELRTQCAADREPIVPPEFALPPESPRSKTHA